MTIIPLEIVRNDITKMQVEAIVNTANPHPVMGGGGIELYTKPSGRIPLPDHKVKVADSFTDDISEWKFVDNFSDIKIKYVTSFPGVE